MHRNGGYGKHYVCIVLTAAAAISDFTLRCRVTAAFRLNHTVTSQSVTQSVPRRPWQPPDRLGLWRRWEYDGRQVPPIMAAINSWRLSALRLLFETFCVISRYVNFSVSLSTRKLMDYRSELIIMAGELCQLTINASTAWWLFVKLVLNPLTPTVAIWVQL